MENIRHARELGLRGSRDYCRDECGRDDDRLKILHALENAQVYGFRSRQSGPSRTAHQQPSDRKA